MRHTLDIKFDVQLDRLITQMIELQQELLVDALQEYLPENLRGAATAEAAKWLSENKFVIELGGCTIRITKDGVALKELRVTYSVDVDDFDKRIVVPE